MNEIDVTTMSTEQLEQLLADRKAKEQKKAQERREAYDAIKSEVLAKIEGQTRHTVASVKELYDSVKNETMAFYEIMKEYGQLKSSEQRSFTLKSDDFCIDVKSNKVKGFDERADIAASRLIEFLNGWISGRSSVKSDPMYKLAMMMLERNRDGDFDYKSISRLYKMETEFNDPEYSEIMRLFNESNVIDKTSVNFYFYERSDLGVWRKLEPSFNRM